MVLPLDAINAESAREKSIRHGHPSTLDRPRDRPTSRVHSENEVEVTIEIRANVPESVPDHVKRTVSENCRTLKFRDCDFEAG